jgi:hypothetical protein
MGPWTGTPPAVIRPALADPLGPLDEIKLAAGVQGPSCYGRSAAMARVSAPIIGSAEASTLARSGRVGPPVAGRAGDSALRTRRSRPDDPEQWAPAPACLESTQE